jgi:hypothetical protein
VASWYEAEVNVRFLLTVALCSWPTLAQPNQKAESNMSCVKRLQMPVYPPLAAAARISGSVTTTATIASGGSYATRVVGNAILAEAGDKALRASSFQKACGGKTVELIFNFAFDSDPGKSVSFAYPNQFWIYAPPQVIETQP